MSQNFAAKLAQAVAQDNPGRDPEELISILSGTNVENVLRDFDYAQAEAQMYGLLAGKRKQLGELVYHAVETGHRELAKEAGLKIMAILCAGHVCALCGNPIDAPDNLNTMVCHKHYTAYVNQVGFGVVQDKRRQHRRK